MVDRREETKEGEMGERKQTSACCLVLRGSEGQQLRMQMAAAALMAAHMFAS